MKPTISENRTTEVRGVTLVAKKLKPGQYGLYSPDGVLRGTAIRRSCPPDWYAEVAIGDEFYNTCDDTLAFALWHLNPRKERVRFVQGKGAQQSKEWAERLRTNLLNIETMP